MQQIFSNLKQAIAYSRECLKTYGQLTTAGSWQGIRKPVEMFEVDNVYWRAQMPQSITALQSQVDPDLPWAEDHFLERISGNPLNPGEQYKRWPGYKDKDFNDVNFRVVNSEDEKKFSHTYMERYWPKRAGGSGEGSGQFPKIGIRYAYGDLLDVMALLRKEPLTRQAYLPVWFPEDTGVVHGGRVPCTIGYHFMVKHDELHIHYMIRACDFIRHFRNDVYMTVRLAQWALEYLQHSGDKEWQRITLGTMTMDIIHFHVFAQEKNII
jgi:hypothetical protein